MLTTTSEYKTEISKTGRHFLNKIIINETEYTGIKNFSYHGGTNSSDHISIGDAVSAYIEFTLTDYPSKMLTGQIATAYIGLQLSDSVEWIKIGVFHLDKPKRNGNYLDITAYDNFSLMEKGFYSDLSGNQKIVDILNEQCNKIGISFVGGADDVYYNVDLLKGSSVREAVSILAAYCGKNAIINRDGNLKFVWFDDIGVTLTDDYYNDTIEFDEEDTVIKRLDCTNETETLSIGTGIGIVFSCPGMTQERLNVLYNRINGFTYRAVSFDWQRARPDIEAGDMINLTIKGNDCAVPLMDFILNCDGGCYGSIESKGKTQEEQDHEFKSPSEARYNFVYEEVISVKKVMSDTIDAWQGNFESIETNFLTVNKKITALEGEFGKINVDELIARIATIEQAYISKAEVEELYATKAEIGILDADVANIKTLLAGSTTTGDLQSIVINSKNAIIENGTIKNAMIESLAFDKITGVDINTTKLTVHSDDGKSTWRDNTIQISDATRVRVQIGKDASNDYNIYIWDKTGKLMFDATGVTADGIQRPIIRDDMVSDTANINGKKINIQSVVKEINNGTEKIKSSTVLYDPTGQTLNIAFNELITTVDGIDDRIESNTTQISVANGEISTLISKTTQMQTDLSSAQGNITDLSTKYNQMKQTVDSYGVTIGEHTSQITTVRDDLDNLQVGGRNILVNSDFLRETYGWVIESTTMTYKVVDDDKVGKYLSLKSTAAGNVNGNRIYQINFANGDTGHIANQVYSLSFYAKTTSTTAVGIHAGWVSGLKTLSISGTTWKRYAVTYTTTGTGSMTIYIDKANTELHIAQIKLEKGNKATDWTPAPEDIESSITEVSDKQSSMQLDLDGFKTSVSNTYATKTQLNTVDGKFANYSTTTQMNTAINQSASNIKLEASKTYATKNELTGKVDTDKVVSAINVSPEEIKIQSSKITLEGIVTANSRFKILADGSMEAVNGKFSGSITATSGTIGGWNINTTLLGSKFVSGVADGNRSGIAPGIDPNTHELKPSTGLCFWAGASYSTSLGHVDLDGAPFRVYGNGSVYANNVHLTGDITATSGKIGDFRINQYENGTYLMKGSGSTSAGMGGYQAFYAGSELSNSAPFRVSYDGKLVATNATISGSITGSTITGSTINVTTDLRVGNNIYLGNQSATNVYKYAYFSSNTFVGGSSTAAWIKAATSEINLYGGSSPGINAKTNGYISLQSGSSDLSATIININGSSKTITLGGATSITATASSSIELLSGYAVRFRNGTGKKISYWDGSGTFGGYFTPGNPDNVDKITLGTEDYRWYRLYSQLGVYTPSDIRKKTNIREYDKRFEDMYMDLKPIIYDFKNDIGNSHCGLIAQWTKDAMINHGITDKEFGVFEYNSENDSYGIIYSEIPSLNMHMIQKTIKRVNTHDKEIAELKSEIARLQSKLEAYVNGTIEIKRA